MKSYRESIRNIINKNFNLAVTEEALGDKSKLLEFFIVDFVSYNSDNIEHDELIRNLLEEPKYNKLKSLNIKILENIIKNMTMGIDNLESYRASQGDSDKGKLPNPVYGVKSSKPDIFLYGPNRYNISLKQGKSWISLSAQNKDEWTGAMIEVLKEIPTEELAEDLKNTWTEEVISIRENIIGEIIPRKSPLLNKHFERYLRNLRSKDKINEKLFVELSDILQEVIDFSNENIINDKNRLETNNTLIKNFNDFLDSYPIVKYKVFEESLSARLKFNNDINAYATHVLCDKEFSEINLEIVKKMFNKYKINFNFRGLKRNRSGSGANILLKAINDSLSETGELNIESFKNSFSGSFVKDMVGMLKIDVREEISINESILDFLNKIKMSFKDFLLKITNAIKEIFNSINVWFNKVFNKVISEINSKDNDEIVNNVLNSYFWDLELE